MIDPVTVCLTLDGGPPIVIGKYSSNIRARDLSGERHDLATLLRAYADWLDNEALPKPEVSRRVALGARVAPGSVMISLPSDGRTPIGSTMSHDRSRSSREGWYPA